MRARSQIIPRPNHRCRHDGPSLKRCLLCIYGALRNQRLGSHHDVDEYISHHSCQGTRESRSAEALGIPPFGSVAGQRDAGVTGKRASGAPRVGDSGNVTSGSGTRAQPSRSGLIPRGFTVAATACRLRHPTSAIQELVHRYCRTCCCEFRCPCRKHGVQRSPHARYGCC